MKSCGELGKVLKRFSTIFQFTEPLEENLVADEFDLAKTVKEVGLVGAEISVAAPLAAGIISMLTLEFKLDDGTSLWHTFRNASVKFGTEVASFWTVSEIMEYISTKEFWNKVNAYLQEEHRKDLQLTYGWSD